MKKITFWVCVIAAAALFIDWGIMGLELLDGNYNIEIFAYTGFGCMVIMLAALLCRSFFDRCPHCGKTRASKGKYCPYCGKQYE